MSRLRRAGTARFVPPPGSNRSPADLEALAEWYATVGLSTRSLLDAVSIGVA